MSALRLPLVERVLLGILLRGSDAESVRGDIVELYREDLTTRGERVARRRLRRQVLRSCGWWWLPSSISGRRPSRHGRRAGLGTGSGHAPASAPRRVGQIGTGLSDLRLAARTLARQPGFALGVAVTLGLGIGATTTVYSVVDGVLLSPLPHERPGRLAAVGATFPNREWDDEAAGLQHLAGISMLNFVDFRERNRSFEQLAGVEGASSILLPDTGRGPELVAAAAVSPELFEILGVAPALGRTFLPAEDSVASERVLMISYGAWQRRFGGDPGVVGEPLERVGLPATIVGVLPRDFDPPEAFLSSTPDFWMPLQPDHPRYGSRGRRSLFVLGRLAEGATVESAREEAGAIASELAHTYPDGNVFPNGSHFGIGINGLHAQTVGTTGRTLRLFLGAAALLLLLAAMNAATLLLAHSLDRVRELSVRTALGAGPLGVIRLLLSEAVLLAAAGGLVGIAMAYGGVAAFLRYAPSSLPRLGEVSVDARVLAVAVAVSLLSGLAAGLFPALRLSRAAPWERLQGQGRGTVGGAFRLRSALVGGQVAVAVVLLSGAALLLSSFVRILSAEPGFDPDGVITMNVALKRPDAPPGEEAWQGWDRVLEELSAVPGVDALAGTTNPPFQSPFWAPRLLLPGDSPETWREGIAGYAVTPGYFEAMGTQLLRGRGIERLDGPDAQRVAVVNETFLRTQLDGDLSGADPLDVVVRQVGDDDEVRELRIVGVVEDTIQGRAEEGRRAAIYVPYTQSSWPFVQAVVRTDLPAELIVPELRRAIARFSPIVPPRDVRTLRDRMAATRTSPRFQTMLIGSFALLALLLAAAGLYGTLSHAVRSRERELGVRMALGAARRDVLRLVFRQGMRISLLGLAIGLLGALGSTKTLTALLYGVEPHDPLTFVLVATVLTLVATSACLVPARRATTVQPVEVLRGD